MGKPHVEQIALRATLSAPCWDRDVLDQMLGNGDGRIGRCHIKADQQRFGHNSREAPFGSGP
jgi:hypothetical protein